MPGGAAYPVGYVERSHRDVSTDIGLGREMSPARSYWILVREALYPS